MWPFGRRDVLLQVRLTEVIRAAEWVDTLLPALKIFGTELMPQSGLDRYLEDETLRLRVVQQFIIIGLTLELIAAIKPMLIQRIPSAQFLIAVGSSFRQESWASDQLTIHVPPIAELAKLRASVADLLERFA
jgi:hypothetical protein